MARYALLSGSRRDRSRGSPHDARHGDRAKPSYRAGHGRLAGRLCAPDFRRRLPPRARPAGAGRRPLLPRRSQSHRQHVHDSKGAPTFSGRWPGTSTSRSCPTSAMAPLFFRTHISTFASRRNSGSAPARTRCPSATSWSKGDAYHAAAGTDARLESCADARHRRSGAGRLVLEDVPTRLAYSTGAPTAPPSPQTSTRIATRISPGSCRS